MDRNRDGRRVAMATPNGLSRRRHRTGSLRDSSPEHDGAMEVQETAAARFRERTGKKERDRESERSERERERERMSRSKRWRGDKFTHDSSDGSVNEEEDEEEDAEEPPVRVPPPNPALTSQRRSYPPTWKASDEMIGVSIPRKARSASTKRPYDSWSSAAGGAGEQFLRQASSSPVASSAVMSPSPAPVSPSSSTLSIKKKNANGPKQRPPKSTKSPPSIQEDIEIEVAEVLYGLMRQSQGPSKQESRDVSTSAGDLKSRAPSRISNSSSAPVVSDSSPKRKKPRLSSHAEEVTVVPTEAPKIEADLEAKPEYRPPKIDKIPDLPASAETEKVKEVSSSVEKKSVQRITTATGDKESCREEKFEIDLMAPPPQSRSSPERRGGDMDYHAMAVDGEAELCLKPREVEKAELNTTGVVGEIRKPKLNSKGKDTSLQFGLEKSVVAPSPYDDKLNHQGRNQAPLLSLKPSRIDRSADKTAQPSSLPPLSAVPAGWPPGHPPMGYVAPLQGAAVSMDGRTLAPTPIQPPHFVFTQPRPGRCATHGYIAKSILSHHQFMKSYPIWPAAAGAAPLFSASPCNLNVVPAADLHGTAAVRGDVNADKGQAYAFLPGQQPAPKDKSAQPATNIIVEDGAQKKQQFFQSLPPHGGPSNMMHGPATFFFPMNQQQVAAAGAAASSRANSTKPLVVAGAASASTATSTLNATATAGQASPATLSFSYPNMVGNEAGFMAILGNGAYQYTIPTQVGAAQAYRGAPPQVMPFFNGSYYPPPMLHPSQLQQQQQAPPPPQQIHQSHQKPSNSTVVSSSSQKQSQNQLQRSQGSSGNGLASNSAMQTFPAPKSRASETQQQEMGREGSPSTANSSFSRPPNMSVYGQNFALPFNPANFALMTPPVSASGATLGGATNGNHAEKEAAPQGFAMSFNSVSGAMAAGFDNASKAHKHAMLQGLPEASRNNYHHMMSAATSAQEAAQQKIIYHHGSEDKKPGASNSSKVENERKGAAARASASTVQSISFSRPDLGETSAPTVSGNNVVDTSARSNNHASGSARSSRPSTHPTLQQLQQQQREYLAYHTAQDLACRNRVAERAAAASNGSGYPDHLSTASSTAAKFPNAVSAPIVQSSNTSAQSQWKNSGRTTASQVSSPSMSTSTTTSMNNLGQQQQGRPQQGQTQISFGGKPKASNAPQVQQGPNAVQSPSPSMIGSPSASSVSRGHSGSPRMTTSAYVGSKPVQSSSVSTQQQGRNSPSVPSQNSSPVAGPGRMLSSGFFGNTHMPASSSMGSSKPQQLQQQSHQSQQLLQQPQLSKQSIQQAQMFFNASYMQAHSTSTTPSSPGGFQLQRHRPEQQQQPLKSQGAPTSTLGNGSTNDPVKAIAAAAAAAGNVKAGSQSQNIHHAAQSSGGAPMLVSSGFPYVHAVPAAAVQVKPTEQKQPAA